MKNLMCLVLILFATNVFAASGSGNISSVIQLGGVSLTDNLFIPEANPQGYFTLGCAAVGTTANHYYPCSKSGTQYQVTAGKTFNATKVCILSSATSNSFVPMNATASFANDATTVTGGVYLSMGSGNYPFYTSVTANTYQCYDIAFTAAASTFVGIQFSTGAINMSAFIIGKEI